MRFAAWALGAFLFLGAEGGFAAEMGPAGAVVAFCHGYSCSIKTPVRLTPKDMAALKAMVAKGRASPAAERKALGSAEQWFEKRAAQFAGTAGDRPKGDFAGAFDPTQLDCIDESTNTTTFLKLIEARGWLVHHTVSRTRARGFLLDGRYPHNTAVVKEKGTGVEWAIDSWIPANGEYPDIKPLSQWLREGGIHG
jgi:hypothetical protein